MTSSVLVGDGLVPAALAACCAGCVLWSGRRSAPAETFAGGGVVAVDDRQAFLLTLDVLATGLGFFAADGELVHANRPLLALFAHGEQGALLRQETGRFASSLCARLDLRAHGPDRVAEELDACEVPGPGGRLRLRGSYIGPDLFGRGPSFLVSVDRTGSHPVPERRLREEFRLTSAQCRVALLLAEGRSNRKIAAELGISPHTARNHTRVVLAKLGAANRAQVAAALQRLREE